MERTNFFQEKDSKSCQHGYHFPLLTTSGSLYWPKDSVQFLLHSPLTTCQSHLLTPSTANSVLQQHGTAYSSWLSLHLFVTSMPFIHTVIWQNCPFSLCSIFYPLRPVSGSFFPRKPLLSWVSYPPSTLLLSDLYLSRYMSILPLECKIHEDKDRNSL